MSSLISTTPITVLNLKQALGLSKSAVNDVEAQIQAKRRSSLASRSIDTIQSLWGKSKFDQACRALEQSTISFLERTHYLPHSEATTKARNLSIFLLNQLDPSTVLQRAHLLHDPIDLFDSLERAPYGDGLRLAYPPRGQAEIMIFRTRKELEETLNQYDQLNPAPILNEHQKKHLETCRERFTETILFTDYPNCSIGIKKAGSLEPLNQEELYEIWWKLRNAKLFVQNLCQGHVSSTRSND